MSAALARIPVDPDLDRALLELSGTVHKLAMIEEQIILPDNAAQYSTLGRLITTRDELRDKIAIRAKQLNVSPGALRLFVQRANSFRGAARRKPSLAELQRDVIRARDALREHKRERDADQAIAAFRACQAGDAVNEAEEAVNYLEACRG